MDNRMMILGTGLTDTGKNRDSNEDTLYFGQVGDAGDYLAMVIDGCGGYHGGAEAARITREEILAYFHETEIRNKAEMLKHALVRANNSVNAARRQQAGYGRMCCVATAVLFCPKDGCMHLAHVGDTRLYAFLDGRIVKLSHDHSPVGRDEELGRISETEAMKDLYRNIIERALGEHYLTGDTVYIETDTLPITAGLTWLLCSDGLCDMITSARMSDILSDGTSIQQQAESLVKAANDAGGKDNITVVIVRSTGYDTSGVESVMAAYAARLDTGRSTAFNGLLDGMTVPSQQASDDITYSSDDGTGHSAPDSDYGIDGCISNTDGGKSVTIDSIPEDCGQPETKPAHKPGSKTVRWLLWLLLVVVLAYGIFAYRTHRRHLVEKQVETERQERLMRSLYYNIYKPVLPPRSE